MTKLSLNDIVRLAAGRRLPVLHEQTETVTHVHLGSGQILELVRRDTGNPDHGLLISGARLLDGENDDKFEELNAEQIEALSRQFVHDPYGVLFGAAADEPGDMDFSHSDDDEPQTRPAKWLREHWFETHLRECVTTFDKAPEPVRLAILHRLDETGDIPAAELMGLDAEESDARIRRALEKVEVAYVEVPASDVKSLIEEAHDCNPELPPEHKSWPTYHRFYLRYNAVPDYPVENRWPVLTWADNEEVFEDGWHRLHSYMRSNHATIPVMAFDREGAFKALSGIVALA